MVVEKQKKTISTLLLEKEKFGSTIACLEEEVTLLKSKLDNMTICMYVEPHIGPSVGAPLTWKKYVTKTKSLKRKLVQTSDSDSDVDEDWVNFLALGGRFG